MINTKIIENFMAKARSASQTGSKEIRIMMPEANELAIAIAQLLARNVTLVEEVRNAESLLGNALSVDGGSFT